jgi:putative addiction module component (TIGR02574 family)
MAEPPPFDYSKLSVAERLELVEDLWDYIAQDADVDTLPLTDDERRLLDERLAAHARDPDRGAPWEEVKARILNRGR